MNHGKGWLSLKTRKKKIESPESLLDKSRPVFIKTYLFESGLFYLGKSLGDHLTSLGFDVFYIPKERYALDGLIYKKTYPKPKFDLGIPEDKILMLNEDAELRTTTLHKVIKYNPGAIISFETFTGKHDWINHVRRNGLKIIDVPMIEWVDKQSFNGKSYKVFDQIWGLNHLCFDTFQKTYIDVKEKIKNVRWNFADKDIVNSEKKSTFIHFGSLNEGLDVKNTKEVLKAFKKVSDLRPDISFVYVGKQIPEQKGINNLTAYNTPLVREEVIKLCSESACVVAPSQREGLGLSIIEGLAAGAKVITTDSAPMNEYSGLILCKPEGKKSDFSLIPLSLVNNFEIFNAMLKYLSDFHGK